MFKKTFLKLNKASLSNMTSAKPGESAGDLYEAISSIKRRGENLFGVMYSNHKRHTVYKPVEQMDYAKSLKRRNAFDYINNFTSVILPKIEDFVEKKLLDKFKANLTEAEQELVTDVYRMRRHIADMKTTQSNIKESRLEEEQDTSTYHTLDGILISQNGEGFKYHDYSDIGKYVLFPSFKRQEYFPFGCYGDYMKKEFEKTNMFSVMVREEGIKLARAFSNITTHEERLKMIDYEAILNRRINFKEELKNYESFSLYFQEVAYNLLKFIETSKNYEYKYIFTHPEIFDGLVTVLVRFMRFSPFSIFLMCPSSRNKIFEHIVKTIHEELGNSFKYTSKDIIDKELKVSEEEFFPITDFAQIVEKIKLFVFELDYKDVFEFAESLGVELEDKLYEEKSKDTKGKFTMNLASHWEHCQFQWRPQEMREEVPAWKGFNTGVLLTGEGNGKSMILTYLHSWAKESGWFVVPIGDVNKYLKDGYPIERHISGIYFQPELAVSLLTDIKIVNYDLLRSTRVDLNEFGKFNIAGTYDDDAEPNMVLWDHRSQTYTNSWQEFNATAEEEIVAHDHPDHTTRLSHFLPKPKTLLDIVNYGIGNERMATCAFAELMHALSRSEKHKTMFLVDNYNELFKPSGYGSYKYANFKDYDGKIPPHDIALCRMFMKFDGHMFKQGVKVCAISLKAYQMHNFKPDLIKFPRGYSLKVDNLKLNDVRNAMYYYIATGFVHHYDDLEIQDVWQLSQGNWKHLHQDLKYCMRSIPAQDHWLRRKETKRIIQESRKF